LLILDTRTATINADWCPRRNTGTKKASGTRVSAGICGTRGGDGNDCGNSRNANLLHEGAAALVATHVGRKGAVEQVRILEFVERHANGIFLNACGLSDIADRALAVTETPDRRGGLAQVMDVVAFLVIDENFVLDLSGNQVLTTCARHTH